MRELRINEKALMGIFDGGHMINWQMTHDRFDRLELREKWANRGRKYEVRPIHVFTTERGLSS